MTETLMYPIQVPAEAGHTTTVAVTRVEGGGYSIKVFSSKPTPLSATAGTSPDEAAVEAKIRARWANESPGSSAPHLVQALRDAGRCVVVPAQRVTTKDAEPYLRLAEKSKSGKRVTAYINTRSMIVTGKQLRPLVGGLQGASVHSNGHVYFDVDDIDACMVAVEEMLGL